MLICIDANGNRIQARYSHGPADYLCPECNERLMLKAGRVKVPHFAHFSESGCRYGEGESVLHRQMKTEVGDLFERFNPQFEVRFGVDRRADIVIARTVIECQVSPITIEEWNNRTWSYNDQGYSVLWIWDIGRFSLSNPYPDIRQTERRIPAEIRYAHQMGYGRVYVLDRSKHLYSCHLFPAFERYSEWYSVDMGDYMSSSYTPRTLKCPGFHAVRPHVNPYRGPEGHLLVQLNDGIWWKEKAA